MIGEGKSCFVIAEAGSNHDGNIEQAKRLIEIAADAGADAVKFQLFRAKKLYPENSGQSDYLGINRSIFDIVTDMEMPYDWIPRLADYCKRKGIIFLSSAFDEESVDRLDPYVPAYKVASYEMTHLPLIRHIAGKGKPVIISTGTADLVEVSETVETFFQMCNQNLALMQCTAAYPAMLDALNLKAIVTLKEKFNVPVGLSDHSSDPLIGPLGALALGANLIEKHFTLNKQLPGPDHSFAIEPAELISMIKYIRDMELALGDGEKRVQPQEMELRKFARRSIFATQDILPGETLSPKNIEVLRCGKLAPGLEPKYFQSILGTIASQMIKKGSSVQKNDYV